jgi:hypothetical protein
MQTREILLSGLYLDQVLLEELCYRVLSCELLNYVCMCVLCICT